MVRCAEVAYSPETAVVTGIRLCCMMKFPVTKVISVEENW
jgi:hypothetical protein